MSLEFFRSVKHYTQRRCQVVWVRWFKLKLPAPALTLVLLLLSTMPTASANPPNTATAASAVVKATGTTTAATTVSALAPDIHRIKQSGELVIAMLATDLPPFFYEKNGQLLGLEVELARTIAKALNVEVRFNREAKTFNEVVELVAQRRADLGISTLSRSLSRAQMVYFSQPYLTLQHALVINRVAFARLSANTRLEVAIRQYSGSLGVMSGSSYVEFAKRDFPKAKLTEFATSKEGLKMVKAGEIVALYSDEFNIKRLLKEAPEAALTLRTVTLKDVEDTLGIAVGVNDPTLLAFVNQMLSQQRDKLNIQKVLNALENSL
jgi:ABC-type amino acid transport substrate-binding protein